MSEWKAKRFWKQATTAPEGDGFSVLLDGRPVRTPAKTHLIVPTEAMAQAIAAEWDAQEGEIKPETMPITRSANAALDKVVPQFDEVVALLADYGGTDLLCYRAATPAELAERQAQSWDPLIDWAATALGAPLHVGAGVMHIPQPEDSLARLKAQVGALNPFQLAAFHDQVSLSGSLVLAFAVTERRLSPDEAWSLSRIDEAWQAEQWGEDEEAAEHAALKKASFLSAAHIFWLT